MSWIDSRPSPSSQASALVPRDRGHGGGQAVAPRVPLGAEDRALAQAMGVLEEALPPHHARADQARHAADEGADDRDAEVGHIPAGKRTRAPGCRPGAGAAARWRGSAGGRRGGRWRAPAGRADRGPRRGGTPAERASRSRAAQARSGGLSGDHVEADVVDRRARAAPRAPRRRTRRGRSGPGCARGASRASRCRSTRAGPRAATRTSCGHVRMSTEADPLEPRRGVRRRLEVPRPGPARERGLGDGVDRAPARRRRCPAPPHWATSRPPGRSAANRRSNSRSWSAIQWNVAVERIASTGWSSSSSSRSATNTSTPAPQPLARLLDHRRRAVDGHDLRRAAARSTSAAVTRPVPQPASSTRSSPRSSRRSSTSRPIASSGAETRS